MATQNKNLKKLIEEKFGSVYAFIKETDLPPSYVYKLTRGDANPTVSQIKKLSEKLEVTEEEVFNALRND